MRALLLFSPLFVLFHPCFAQAPSPHVCLKAKEVNWRKGPGYEHPIDVVFSGCVGWPVVIRKKCWHWYYVEDPDGYVGWIHTNMIAFKRSILIAKDMTPLRSSPHPQGAVVAYLKKGVVGRFHRQKAGWYRISVASYKGWVFHDACWEPPQ